MIFENMNTHILQRCNNILFEWSVELISDPTYSGRQIRSWTVMWHKAMPLSVYVKTQSCANAYLNTRLLSYMVNVFYVHITTFYSTKICLIISNLTLLKFATARARGCARPATSIHSMLPCYPAMVATCVQSHSPNRPS
jgi:hypothetical protein